MKGEKIRRFRIFARGSTVSIRSFLKFCLRAGDSVDDRFVPGRTYDGELGLQFLEPRLGDLSVRFLGNGRALVAIVARYCQQSRFKGGEISDANFAPRPRDSGRLSTNWVECIQVPLNERNDAGAVARLRRRLQFDQHDYIALLQVKEVRKIGAAGVSLDVREQDGACHAVIMNALIALAVGAASLLTRPKSVGRATVRPRPRDATARPARGDGEALRGEAAEDRGEPRSSAGHAAPRLRGTPSTRHRYSAPRLSAALRCFSALNPTLSQPLWPIEMDQRPQPPTVNAIRAKRKALWLVRRSNTTSVQ
ncbi:MAG: hypothetical protein ACLP7J_16770 [Streptosporangiaceae bacterium]